MSKFLGEENMRKLVVVALSLVAGSAFAVVPPEVETMFSTFQSDGLSVIGSGAVLAAALVGGWLIVKFAMKVIKGAK